MTGRIEQLETIHDGVIGMKCATVRMDDGSTARREIVDHPDGVAILLYDPDRRTALLVTELRPPVEWLGRPRMLEVVAGTLDEADPAACARREAMEEAGVKVTALEHVACLWPTPNTSTEQVHYYLAPFSQSDRVAAGGGLEDEQEVLRIREVSLADLSRMAEQGELSDAKTFLLLQALRLRRPDLF